VQEYLKEKHVTFVTHEHMPEYTAQEVAAQEHVSGNMLAKAGVVKVDDEFAICVLPASFKLDMAKVARELGARDVCLADELEMARLFPDAEVGAEPPMGMLYNLPTLVDEHLAQDPEIVFQAGTHKQSIRMSFEDYADLVNPTVADLAVHL
jgi:Ala-tRNA(Pro) deacylase